MELHLCPRCDGCGHVTGAQGWEIPWTLRMQTGPGSGALKPRLCPDCTGSGALPELPRADGAHGQTSGARRQPRPPQHIAVVLPTKVFPHCN